MQARLQGMREIAGLQPSRKRGSPRPVSLIASLALHALFCWTLLNVLPPQVSAPQDLTDEEFFAPQHSPIVWYHLQKLPEVSPEQGVQDKKPAAQDVSRDTLISRSQAAHPSRQVVRQPDQVQAPKIQLPDMIALKKGNEALPAAAPLPAAALPDRPEAAVKPEPVKVTPKAFVPPAPAPSAAKKPTLAAPQIPVADPSTTVAGGAPAGQNEINALVLNLLPAAARVPPPGQSDASAAPAGGSSGESRGSGIHVAGVTAAPGIVPGKAVDSAPKPEAPKPIVVTSIASLQNTLSAPLPPSSRAIPASIEAHFRGRVVYAMIVPMKKVPGYAGDWVIWFAEHQAADGGAAAIQMRSPLPVRKSIASGAGELPLPQSHVQISALIDKLGQVGSIAIAGSGSPASNDAAIADLKSWEFLPATRNRQPVDVDVVVEVTYSSGSSLSR